MTRLLVSVRSAHEAILALAGGADLIDIKEPSRGPLGAADPPTMAEIAAAVRGRAPLSAALGELVERPEIPGADLDLDYAKVGLAGCAHMAGWAEAWRAFVSRLPGAILPAAVVYADWEKAAAPAPEAVLEAAAKIGCKAVLIDTFDKRGGPLTTIWPFHQLETFVASGKKRQLKVVLAGSLCLTSIPIVLPLVPDYVAVRGAACSGGRRGMIDRGMVAELSAALSGSRSATLSSRV